MTEILCFACVFKFIRGERAIGCACFICFKRGDRISKRQAPTEKELATSGET
jgi:hypothetical protein